MAEYIIQKAVAPEKVKVKLRRTLEEYGQTFDAYAKYDGCCAILDGYRTLSRTGEVYRCLDENPLQLLARQGGLVIIGEAWWPGKDQFNLISGEFRRMQVSRSLFVMVHDVLYREEFDAGYSAVSFSERMARLPEHSGVGWEKARRYPAGTYGCPQALCNQLADEGGYDGLVLRDPNGTWTRGSGTTGEIIKIKRVLSFDLRATSWEPGQGKHDGRMGAIVVDFRGKELRVGTGFTDEFRKAVWRDADDHEIFKPGVCVEIEAMDYSSDGLLREPRFKGVRFDKVAPDA